MTFQVSSIDKKQRPTCYRQDESLATITWLIAHPCFDLAKFTLNRVVQLQLSNVGSTRAWRAREHLWKHMCSAEIEEENSLWFVSSPGIPYKRLVATVMLGAG